VYATLEREKLVWSRTKGGPFIWTRDDASSMLGGSPPPQLPPAASKRGPALQTRATQGRVCAVQRVPCIPSQTDTYLACCRRMLSAPTDPPPPQLTPSSLLVCADLYTAAKANTMQCTQTDAARTVPSLPPIRQQNPAVFFAVGARGRGQGVQNPWLPSTCPTQTNQPTNQKPTNQPMANGQPSIIQSHVNIQSYENPPVQPPRAVLAISEKRIGRGAMQRRKRAWCPTWAK
jgi:hypothetical protein